MSGGRFVATWTDASVGALSLEVKAQLFNADGTKVGSEFTVNTTAVSHQFDLEVTALADGRFVVTWADYAGGYHDVRAQVFNADGTKLGSELLVNQQMTGSQWLPDVAALSDGRIVFTWSDYSGTAGGPRAVRARIAELTSSFTGTGADDTLTGTAGRDEITGGAGNDTLTGLAGDDALKRAVQAVTSSLAETEMTSSCSHHPSAPIRSLTSMLGLDPRTSSTSRQSLRRLCVGVGRFVSGWSRCSDRPHRCWRYDHTEEHATDDLHFNDFLFV